MAKQSARKRPSYEPNATFVRRLHALSGKSIADFAHDCGCGESTLHKMLDGEPVDGQTLIQVASKLKLKHWHDLLSDAERARMGLPPIDAFASAQLAHRPASHADVDSNCAAFGSPLSTASSVDRLHGPQGPNP